MWTTVTNSEFLMISLMIMTMHVKASLRSQGCLVTVQPLKQIFVWLYDCGCCAQVLSVVYDIHHVHVRFCLTTHMGIKCYQIAGI